MAHRVTLDAMIPRADFATQDHEFTMQLFKDFPITNLEESSKVLALLRKPDFQRETNHWSAAQIVTFIESFLDNQLIPALILWKSPTYIFVIDGGHRLSALRAWILDDYGDGPLSQHFYGGEISDAQKRIAKSTRALIERRVGRYSVLKQVVGSTTSDVIASRRAGNLVTRALDLQWVQGNADVAETSFFNINTQGTPLDSVEAMLIRNRDKALAIASRAVLRAGSGNKYWSRFDTERQIEIEKLAKYFNGQFFDPEVGTPVRTLELPLGGSVSPVTALGLLVEFFAISASREDRPLVIADEKKDVDGSSTVEAFKNAKDVLRRIVGNDPASLGLHPAVYFYNEHGVYLRHLFLGVIKLITEKVKNNDSKFFREFTAARRGLEDFLIKYKATLNLAFANINRSTRVLRFRDLIDGVVQRLNEGAPYTIDEALVTIGLAGRTVELKTNISSGTFSPATKTEVFFKEMLVSAPRCPICGGLLFPTKSVHFDHKQRVREDGSDHPDNAQMTHPYCNSVVKR